jgi:hypothetical protein
MSDNEHLNPDDAGWDDAGSRQRHRNRSHPYHQRSRRRASDGIDGRGHGGQAPYPDAFEDAPPQDRHPEAPAGADQDLVASDIGMHHERWLTGAPPAVTPCPICLMPADDVRRQRVERVLLRTAGDFQLRCGTAHAAYERIRRAAGDGALPAANAATLAVHAKHHVSRHDMLVSLQADAAQSLVHHLSLVCNPMRMDARGNLVPVAPPSTAVKNLLDAMKAAQLLASQRDNLLQQSTI